MDFRYFGGKGSETLLVQPVDVREMNEMEAEAAAIAQMAPGVPFCLAAFAVDNWSAALSPWPAPPAFGDQPFAGEAAATLARLESALPRSYKATIIGGYSLAGLFALWAACESDAFDGAAGASPSVWFPGWIDYLAAHRPNARAVYLSLGDKEARTRNPVMRTVDDRLRATHRALLDANIPAALEWNPGNHFANPAHRTAKGFAWLLQTL